MTDSGDRDKAENEEVNGALIASELIKRLPQERQEQILNAISKSSPDIAIKVEENLLSFADFLKDSPRVIQTLIRETSDQELAVGLINIEDSVKSLFLENMSARRRESVLIEQQEQKRAGALTFQQVKTVQLRLLSSVREIRTRNLNSEAAPVKKEFWA